MNEKLSFRKLNAIFHNRTEKAVLVEFPPRDDRIWIPRTLLSSLCDREIEELKRHDEFVVHLIDWKAEELGL
jgi:hypothetical protein